MSERKTKLRETMVSDHAACMAILRGLSDDQWLMPAPSENEAPWQARDVLAHLAVSEAGQLGQITRVLGGQAGVPDDFDVHRWNRRSVQKQAARTVPEMLDEIEQGHAQVLSALEALDEADLDKTGRHARGDSLTVEQFFHRITEHRRQHAEELQRAVAG